MSDIHRLLTRLAKYVPNDLADQIAADITDSLWLAEHDAELESALASERAARTAAENRLALIAESDMVPQRDVDDATDNGIEWMNRARAAEATIAQVREWTELWPEWAVPGLRAILDAAPSAARDAHDAQVKAEALEEAAEVLGIRATLLSRTPKLWLRARAAEIRKAAQ